MGILLTIYRFLFIEDDWPEAVILSTDVAQPGKGDAGD